MEVLAVNVSVPKFPVSSVSLINKLSVVFTYDPSVGTVTSKLIIQLLFGASVPSENEIESAPAIGLKVGEPHPVVDAFGVGATTMLSGEVGKVSEKFTPPMVDVVGFVNVIFKLEVLPGVITSGTNCFLIVILEGPTIFTPLPVVEKSAL